MAGGGQQVASSLDIEDCQWPITWPCWLLGQLGEKSVVSWYLTIWGSCAPCLSWHTCSEQAVPCVRVTCPLHSTTHLYVLYSPPVTHTNFRFRMCPFNFWGIPGWLAQTKCFPRLFSIIKIELCRCQKEYLPYIVVPLASSSIVGLPLGVLLSPTYWCRTHVLAG